VEGGATVLIFISAYYFWSRWVSNESIGWENISKNGLGELFLSARQLGVFMYALD